MGVSLSRQGVWCILSLKQVVQKVGGFLSEDALVSKSSEANELSKCVSSHITLLSLLGFHLLVKVAIEDANTVELLLWVAGLLHLSEELYAISPVFNDSIDEG